MLKTIEGFNLEDERPMWDQLTLFGPPPQAFERARSMQLDLAWDSCPRNVVVIEAAEAISRAMALS